MLEEMLEEALLIDIIDMIVTKKYIIGLNISDLALIVGKKIKKVFDLFIICQNILTKFQLNSFRLNKVVIY